MDKAADALMILPGDILLIDHHIIDSVIDALVKIHDRYLALDIEVHMGASNTLFKRALSRASRDLQGHKRSKESRAKSSDGGQIIETSPAALFDLGTQQDFERLKNTCTELQQHTTD